MIDIKVFRWIAAAGLMTLNGVDAGPLRILPAGDSITHGYGSGITILNSYRKALKTLLTSRYSHSHLMALHSKVEPE